MDGCIKPSPETENASGSKVQIWAGAYHKLDHVVGAFDARELALELGPRLPMSAHVERDEVELA